MTLEGAHSEREEGRKEDSGKELKQDQWNEGLVRGGLVGK